MFSKCIELFCGAHQTSSIVVLVLVEIAFPDYLHGKPKLNIRLASGGTYRPNGSSGNIIC
jgi:hypothetical protein